MKQARSVITLISLIVLMGTLLMACSTSDQPSATGTAAPDKGTASPETNETNTNTASAQTRSYTDYMGHTSEIPVNPKHIVFFGETYGDLLALGVQAVGASKDMYEHQAYESQVQGVEDVGFPINLEKTLSLKPDLILYSVTDEKDFEALSKIAPTVIFDTFAPLKKRMTELGDILGKTKEAEAWLAQYKSKEEAMWAELKKDVIKPGETASVLTYYPGNRLFVMAKTGLSQVLYEENGFQPTPSIQKVLDEDKGFEEISLERLKDFAADRIFILDPVADEAKKSTEELMQNPIWKSLPAVKNGHVYSMDIQKTSADASTREWLLQALPDLLGKK